MLHNKRHTIDADISFNDKSVLVIFVENETRFQILNFYFLVKVTCSVNWCLDYTTEIYSKGILPFEITASQYHKSLLHNNNNHSFTMTTMRITRFSCYRDKSIYAFNQNKVVYI